MSKKYAIFAGALVVVLGIGIYTQITIFVVPRIGAVPEGRTVVMMRLNATKFIDSPDAMCERIQNGVSLMCRAIIMGKVISEAKILFRAPYNQTLYDIANDGKKYDR
jgi:hypothetical protein